MATPFNISLQSILAIAAIPAIIACAPIVEPILTLEKYDRLEEGMNLEEVRGTLGLPGVQTSEVTIAGTKGESYLFQEEGRVANAIVTFHDGKLVTKAQYGLK